MEHDKITSGAEPMFVDCPVRRFSMIRSARDFRDRIAKLRPPKDDSPSPSIVERISFHILNEPVAGRIVWHHDSHVPFGKSQLCAWKPPLPLPCEVHRTITELLSRVSPLVRVRKLRELRDFRAEFQRAIKLPWQPNLNDGVLITACPLRNLFRLPKWRKDLVACWKELERGEYNWAHIAYSIWPQSVMEKCKTDRSLAIAHGLEALCDVASPASKAKRARKKQIDLEGLEE